ncbi:MAG: MaoC family dehydratase N-terminal domain-containing protein [Rhodospirillales bacterium]
MATTEDPRLEDWIGRTEHARDRITRERAQALQATLDRMQPPLQDGDPLPALWHWLYFWTIVPRSGLGRDGHPALGGFLPPVGTARRMWAGSRVRFPGRLCIGDDAERRSTIAEVSSKTGRSGRLVFVTVRHEIAGPSGLAIVDEHDIVYREDKGAGAADRAGEPAPAVGSWSERIEADPTMLFRYSALTFNGHRIHYDRTYATGTEGYGGLVVHGPLLATLMAGLAQRSRPQHTLSAFQFRGHRPIIDTAPFTVSAAPQGENALDVWVADAEGFLASKGRADFT